MLADRYFLFFAPLIESLDPISDIRRTAACRSAEACPNIKAAMPSYMIELSKSKAIIFQAPERPDKSGKAFSKLLADK